MTNKDLPPILELPNRHLALFSSLKNPPETLFYTGNLELLNRRKIAIVGSRRASQYARSMTKIIASKLSSLGCVVVSGAAMGIDALAHEGAGENTIALFGNSLDKIYPAVNRSLIEKIYKNSLAISEYEKDTMPTNYSFVLRNRLVVAMSEAVVITEADENSGSMRSAEIALQLGRPIYVLPHRLGESSGSMGLVKKGVAKLIYSVDEFIASLGLESLMCLGLENDELLEFCRKSPSLDEALSLFGDRVYEYELDGKIEIKNNRVAVNR